MLLSLKCKVKLSVLSHLGNKFSEKALKTFGENIAKITDIPRLSINLKRIHFNIINILIFL